MMTSKVWVDLEADEDSGYTFQWEGCIGSSMKFQQEDGWKSNAPSAVNGQRVCAYFDNDPENPGLQDAPCDTPDIPTLCYLYNGCQ